MRWLRAALCIGSMTGCLNEVTLGTLWAQDRPVSTSEPSTLLTTGETATTAISPLAVEMAWLADPITFPYPLKATVQEGKFVVKGLVPTRGIQMRALALAMQLSPVEVVDQIRVQSTMQLVVTEVPNEQFAQEARARLEQVGMPVRKHIELRSTKDGRLIITGYADSEEDKWAYSRCFVGLAGCRAIRNDMLIGFAPMNKGGNAESNSLETLPVPKPVQLQTPVAPNALPTADIKQTTHRSDVNETKQEQPMPVPKLLPPIPAAYAKPVYVPTPAIVKFQ